MYPIHLEKQYERFFETMFLNVAVEFNKAVIKKLKSLKARYDGDGVRHDNREMFEFIKKLKEAYDGAVDQADLEARVAKNFHLLDAWSEAQVDRTLNNILNRLETPQGPSVTGRPTPQGKTGELWMPTVNLMSKNGITAEFRDKAIKTNLELINSSIDNHIDGLTQIFSSGLTQGKSHKTIVNEIVNLTDVERSKAKFWARDQASKFYGQVTQERQTKAGIPGYIWRSLKDARVRDLHSMVSGKYFTWASGGPEVGAKGNNVHPGEDYNCRCWAEPAFGEHYEDKNSNFGNATSPNENSIEENMVVAVRETSLKDGVENATKMIDNILEIKPNDRDGIVSVVEERLVSDDPKLIKSGSYSKIDRVIKLNPDAPLPEVAFIHEYVHDMDSYLIKNKYDKEKLLDIIKETSAYENIVSELRTKGLPENRINHLKYLKKDGELFARACSQYIVEHPNNLNKEFDKIREKMIMKKKVDELTYWEGDDAKKIFNALDDFFRKEGFIK